MSEVQKEAKANFFRLENNLQKLLEPLLNNKEYYKKLVDHLYYKYYSQDPENVQYKAAEVITELDKLQTFIKDDNLSNNEAVEFIIIVLEYYYGSFPYDPKKGFHSLKGKLKVFHSTHPIKKGGQYNYCRQGICRVFSHNGSNTFCICPYKCQACKELRTLKQN